MRMSTHEIACVIERAFCAAVDNELELSFPRWLRARLLRDPALVSEVLCSCARRSPITGDARGVAALPTAIRLRSRRFSWEVRSPMPTPTSTPDPGGRLERAQVECGPAVSR